MATTRTPSRDVIRNPALLLGEPVLAGTRTPVRAIVELWRLGVRQEKIPQRLPYLTLAQVFNALSFYAYHHPEINDYIERNRVPEHLVHPAVRRCDSES